MTPLPNNSVEGFCRSSRTMENHAAAPRCSSSNSPTLNLYSELGRLRTFSKWSAPSIIKRELAAAGFFYMNYANTGDIVKCRYCNFQISLREDGANPLDVHERNSPHCIRLQELKSGMVAEEFDTCGVLERKTRQHLLQDIKVNTTEIPSFPDYASKETRLESYNKWPLNFQLQPEVLAEAGFFYTGTDVKTICFHCGGSLSWEEHDDPFVEHEHWFPECYFIKFHKLRKSAADELATKKAAVSACTPRWPEHSTSPSRNALLANLNLSLESDRLKSFENWPIPFINKNELAAAGFYYTQVEDRVICVYCKIEIGRWEMGDDPAEEHLKHSPNCSHSSYCRTMLEKKGVGSAQSSSSSPLKSYDTCGPYGLPNLKPSIAYPEYTTFESRLNSFRSWPDSAKISANALCEAGFIYVGLGIDDKTICYHCGGGLKDWNEEDEPWIEHAACFPHCDYVLANKGSEFICEAVRKRHDTRPFTEEDMKSAVETLKNWLLTTINPPDVNIGNVNENNGCVNGGDVIPGGGSESQDNLHFKMLCKVCIVNDCNKLFYPCGHMACSKCASNIVNCAFCRKPILDRVQMYFS